MSKSIIILIIADATLASALQVGVTREQQQQYANERNASDRRSEY